MNIKNWTDCSREDLNKIPAMQSDGWSPDFSYTDKRHNRTSPDNVPADSVSFVKDNEHVWKAKSNLPQHSDGIYLIWRYAVLEQGSYSGHKWYETLEDVIKNKPCDETERKETE